MTWRVNNYVSRQRKSKDRRNESTIGEDPYYHFTNQLFVYIAASCYLEESHFVVPPSFIKITKLFQYSLLPNVFLQKMAALRNNRKLAAVATETQEDHSGNGQLRNTSVTRIHQEYLTQVSEEIDSRVTKKLSQEFSRTESRILGALSKLDEFFLKPQVPTESGPVPGISRNTDVENREPNRIVPKMILILMWDPPSIGPITQSIQIQTRLLTVTFAR